jgi:hypothetical protein
MRSLGSTGCDASSRGLLSWGDPVGLVGLPETDARDGLRWVAPPATRLGHNLGPPRPSPRPVRLVAPSLNPRATEGKPENDRD